MAPSGYAIIISAGPASGAGVARVLASPEHGNMAVALLAHNNEQERLFDLCNSLREWGGVLHPFPCDTSPASLQGTFAAIAAHPDFRDLKLRLAVFHARPSLRKPSPQAMTPEEFNAHVAGYATGAFTFAQEALKLMFAQNGGETALSQDPRKKGTVIFSTDTEPGAESHGYGAGRTAVRMIAQGLGREHRPKGIHVAHTIANGSIVDEGSEENDDVRTGRAMSASSIGKLYLFLTRLEPDLWIHELDMRPAQEKC